MKKTLLTIALATLCSFFTALAQEVKPLAIGDTIPEKLWHANLQMVQHADANSSGTLNDFRDQKLIVLDFWATSCASCIEALPGLDSLQREFKKDVVILPVTYEAVPRVLSAFKNNPVLKGINLPVIAEDTLLKKAFPHYIISHEVWIGKDGVVKAITDPQYVNRTNLNRALTQESIILPLKNDSIGYDYSKPTLISPLGQEKLSYSAITPFRDGIAPKLGVQRDSSKGTVRTFVMNFPVIKLYLLALGHFLDWQPSKIILEAEDKNRYFYEKQKEYKRDWKEKNSYCYESILPLSISNKDRTELMRSSLDAFLGLHGRMEQRTLPCLILVRRGELRCKSKGGTPLNTLYTNNPKKKLRNAGLSEVVWELNNQPGAPPALNETGYDGPVDLDLELQSFKATESLRRQLQPYGLDLIEEQRRVTVFVLTEAGYSAAPTPN